MTKAEKNYIITQEKEFWKELLDAENAYGVEDEYVDRLRIKWAGVYEICKHMFPEYKTNVTPAE